MAVDFRVWPWIPQENMLERWEWLTDVMVASNGSEQRVGVRLYPRQLFEASFNLDSYYDRSNAHLAIASGQARVWGWPCWHEQQVIGNQIDTDTVVIEVNTEFSDYRAGGHAILWSSPTAFEAVEINEVTPEAITLSSATLGTFPAGSLIMPLRKAYLSSTVEITDYPVKAGTLKLSVSCLESVVIDGGVDPFQYLGREVLSPPLFLVDGARKREISRNLWMFDPKAGPWIIRSPGEYPVTTTEHYWVSETAEEAWDIKRWFFRRAGRLVPVWVPTRTTDVVLSGSIRSLDMTLTIRDIGLRNYWFDHPGKKHLALVRSDNSIICRQITGVSSALDGNELVELGAAVGVDDVVSASFLSLCRLESDQIEIVWGMAGSAEIKASMVEVAA